MKKIFLLLTVLTVSLSVHADDAEPKGIELTDNERQLVDKNNRFAYTLFSKARDAQQEQVSMLLSPLSITLDLGMLNNGADGITQEEIDAVLGSTVGNASERCGIINSFCHKLLTESGTLDEKTRVAMANNIYVNTASGCELLPAFVETAKNYYDATPESRDFGDGHTRDVINQWGSDHTEGMIEETIKEDEFKPDAVSYLLNALYFKGEWTHKFNAKDTRRHVFDGGRSETQMMYQESDFSYYNNAVYQSVILPYGNMAYQMTVFLPHYGKTINDVLADLSSKGCSEKNYKPCHVDLYLPRFETSTDIHLEDIMKALGMPNAFEGGYGFNEFCNQNVFIGMMKQVAKIKLDEEGTEASAVTVVEMDKNASGPSYISFVADRPFVYTITERSTGAIFFIGQYMGDPLKNPRKDISLTSEERKLVEGNNDFAFRLFQKARGNESSIMSPLSITYALGMLNNGAAGQTQQEINTVLGCADAGSPDIINAFCRKLLTEAPTLDNETTAEIANTIYVNSGRGYELQQGFIDKANEYYDAQPEARNFYDGETRGVINQWANDHTQGMIPEVFPTEQSFNQDAASYLLNALYFKGAWANKFDKTKTRDEAFNGDAMVPMMSQEADFAYTENDLYQAVCLPYGNGAYKMTVFLPREGKTIGDVLAKMSGNIWSSGIDYDLTTVDLKMPRLKTDSRIGLVEIMKELGMPKAFSIDAEFPYFGNRDVFISDMFQKAVIDLDEEGTEAAAVTVIEMYESVQMPVTFHANRPFFYIISEQSTGVIFFIGQYLGDTTTGIKGIDDLPVCDLRRDSTDSHSQFVYDLQGRKMTVGNMPRGLYIHNGRKVIK